MFLILQVATVFLASVTMALSLAHMLELPGKLRLDKQTYCAMQTVYYPGFTYGGFGEVMVMVAALALALMSLRMGAASVWTLIGLFSFVANHAVYWLVTHPANKFWLKDQDLKGLDDAFFKLDPLKRSGEAGAGDDDIWRRLRDRWEYSHVLRAIFSAVGLLALIVAVAVR